MKVDISIYFVLQSFKDSLSTNQNKFCRCDEDIIDILDVAFCFINWTHIFDSHGQSICGWNSPSMIPTFFLYSLDFTIFCSFSSHCVFVNRNFVWIKWPLILITLIPISCANWSWDRYSKNTKNKSTNILPDNPTGINLHVSQFFFIWEGWGLLWIKHYFINLEYTLS